MKEEINDAARVVADLVVQKVDPLTVPIGSLVKIKKEGRMPVDRQDRQPRNNAVRPAILKILKDHPEGLTAAQVHHYLRPHVGPKWAMTNTWNRLSYMKNNTGETKNLNMRWYLGSAANGHAYDVPVTRKVAGDPPFEVKADDINIDAAIDGLQHAMAQALIVLKAVKRRDAALTLAKKQNAARLEAILKLAREE